MNFILPRPEYNTRPRWIYRWSVSTESSEKKESRIRAFEPNTILGWFFEIPLIPIFESLEPHSLFGCDPFILLPL